MRVVVAVAGRFHGFELARELDRAGALAALLTSYPRFAARRDGVAGGRVRCFPVKEIAERLHRRLPASWQWPGAEPLLRDWFDAWAARNLVECDVCTVWSGSGLETLRRAKRAGALTVVERGSAHISVQRALLAEASERSGVPVVLPHPRTVEKELAEYAEADLIAVPSRFVERTFRDQGVPAARLLRIGYGVDLAAFRRRFGEDGAERPFRILHCGAFSLRKGAHHLLQAFARLGSLPAELWVAGPVPAEARPWLERYGANGVRLLGARRQSELAGIYSSCDLLVLFSTEDGFGLVVPQAMACGLPVVCSENTGAADLVEHGRNGFVLPVGNVERLADTLRWCGEHRAACRAMGRVARERVLSGHGWADYGARTLAAYRAALCARSSVAK